MSATQHRRGWKEIFGIAVLTAVAGLAGVGSELLAASSSKFSFKGAAIHTQTDNFANPGSVAWIDAQAGVTGPGAPSGNSIAWVQTDNPTPDGYEDLFTNGGQPFDPAGLTARMSAGSGSGSVTLSGLAGTLETFSWSSGWTDVPVQISANAQTSSADVDQVIQREHRFNSVTGDRFQSRLNQKISEPDEATTTVGISYTDGVTTTTLIPDGTTSWGYAAQVSQGSMTLTK